jgi:hypothetical protein
VVPSGSSDLFARCFAGSTYREQEGAIQPLSARFFQFSALFAFKKQPIVRSQSAAEGKTAI